MEYIAVSLDPRTKELEHVFDHRTKGVWARLYLYASDFHSKTGTLVTPSVTHSDEKGDLLSRLDKEKADVHSQIEPFSGIVVYYFMYGNIILFLSLPLFLFSLTQRKTDIERQIEIWGEMCVCGRCLCVVYFYVFVHLALFS